MNHTYNPSDIQNELSVAPKDGYGFAEAMADIRQMKTAVLDLSRQVTALQRLVEIPKKWYTLQEFMEVMDITKDTAYAYSSRREVITSKKGGLKFSVVDTHRLLNEKQRLSKHSIQTEIQNEYIKRPGAVKNLAAVQSH